jgi:hypothetical protein
MPVESAPVEVLVGSFAYVGMLSASTGQPVIVRASKGELVGPENGHISTAFAVALFAFELPGV